MESQHSCWTSETELPKQTSGITGTFTEWTQQPEKREAWAGLPISSLYPPPPQAPDKQGEHEHYVC